MVYKYEIINISPINCKKSVFVCEKISINLWLSLSLLLTNKNKILYTTSNSLLPIKNVFNKSNILSSSKVLFLIYDELIVIFLFFWLFFFITPLFELSIEIELIFGGL